MINSVKMPRAYSEVYNLINALGDSYVNKIPTSIYNTLKTKRDTNYNPKYEKDQVITDKDISYEGLALISAINLQYLCDNSLEKDELKKIYINNTELENKKFSYNNLFKHSNKNQNVVSVALVEYKQGFFTKIINKIKNLVKRRK